MSENTKETKNNANEAHWLIGDLAKRWRVCNETVRRYVRDRELEAMRIGRKLLVTQDEVTRFEARRRAM